MQKKQIVLPIKLNEDVYERIKKIRAEEDVTYNRLMRMFIYLYDEFRKKGGNFYATPIPRSASGQD